MRLSFLFLLTFDLGWWFLMHRIYRNGRINRHKKPTKLDLWMAEQLKDVKLFCHSPFPCGCRVEVRLENGKEVSREQLFDYCTEGHKTWQYNWDEKTKTYFAESPTKGDSR